jgi:hypothetical protein
MTVVRTPDRQTRRAARTRERVEGVQLLAAIVALMWLV